MTKNRFDTIKSSIPSTVLLDASRVMILLVGFALFGIATRGLCDSTKPVPPPAIQNKLPLPTPSKVQGDELSPDGKWWIAYNANRSLGVISPDGKSSLGIPLIRDATAYWSADSRTLYLEHFGPTGNSSSIESLDLESGKITVLKAEETDSFLEILAPSPSGQYVAVQATNTKRLVPENLEILDTKTGHERILPGLSAASFTAAHWSSDEKKITFIGHDKATNKSGLMTANLQGPLSVMVSPLNIKYFCFSPSGAQVAFIGSRDKKENLNLLSVANEDNKVVLAIKKDKFSPKFLWSEDGRYLYVPYCVFNKGVSILKIDVKTGTSVDIVPMEKAVVQLTAIHGGTLYYYLLIATDAIGDTKSKAMEVNVGE